jgi:hypothetical protein
VSLSLTVSQELEALDRRARQKQRLCGQGSTQRRERQVQLQWDVTTLHQSKSRATGVVSRWCCSSSGESATGESELLPSLRLASLSRERSIHPPPWQESKIHS